MTSALAGRLVGLSGSRMAVILAGVTLTIAAVLVCLRVARRSRASVRHLLLVSAFAVLGVLPIASVLIPSVQIPVPIASSADISPVIATSSVEVTVDDTGGIAEGQRGTDSAPRAARISGGTVVIAIWAIGAAICLLPVLLGLVEMRSLRRSGTPWNVLSVDVLMHSSIRSPVTFGVIHPVIVMPADAQQWPQADLTRAIVHEREHVRRWDWLSQCLARVLCAVYWFHPLVWVARRRLDLEAERACDDAVLRHEARLGEDTDATAYADQLVTLAKRLSSAPRTPLLAMANRADLSARIGALLDSRQRRGRAGLLAIVVASSTAALLVATMSSFKLVAASPAFADATARQAGSGNPPAFEAVSIKLCAPGDAAAPAGGRGGGSTTTSPGRLTIQCSTLINLINRAYVSFGNPPPLNHPNTPDSNIIQGGPAWARSDKYAIEARAEGTPDITTINGPMLRRLLEERFQLKIHEGVKDVSALALTVAPGGLKLKPIDPASCIESSPNNPGPRVLRTSPSGIPQVFASDAGPDAKPYCTTGIGPKSPNLVLDVTGMPFERIVRTLSSLIVDRPVVDRTGVSGQFSFHVEFAVDETIRPQAILPPSDLPGGPSIFAAFEKDLGLKLEPTRAPQGTLIIDRLERPTDTPPAPVQQRFEVASIKPCTPAPDDPATSRGRGAAGGTNASTSPGRFTVPCVTVEQLIYLAYASYGAREDERLVNDYLGTASDDKKIRGGPAWIHSYRDRYAIEATAPGISDRYALMGTLLRSLLEERFQLKIHRETESVPMFALRVAKGGVKLKPMKDSDCDPPSPGDQSPCGFMMRGTVDGSGLSRWHYVGFQLGFLARQLAEQVGRHVVDETGVTDKFTIDLTFASDSASAGGAGDRGAALFKALEEQLGVKLEPITGPQGYIVVDRVERPASDRASSR